MNHRRSLLLAVPIALQAIAGAAPAQAVALLATDGQSIGIVDATHLLTAVVPISGFGRTPLALARDPTTGDVYVMGGFSPQQDSILARLDVDTGVATPVGSHITGESFDYGMAFDAAGTLYGLRKEAGVLSLVRIDKQTAATTVVKALNNHGGSSSFGGFAFDPDDGNFYFAQTDSQTNLFVDRLTAGTFVQSNVLTSGSPVRSARALAFADGKLWLANLPQLYSADAANLGAGFVLAGQPQYPSPFGTRTYFVDAFLPSSADCVPTPTRACLYDRFQVEVTYDATPNNGSGPANAVLESAQTVKFTFFDPNNIEMILKILDACSFNQKWWIYAGGLTDVGVQIKVTDKRTGAVRNYQSAKGKTFQAFADTSALPCP